MRALNFYALKKHAFIEFLSVKINSSIQKNNVPGKELTAHGISIFNATVYFFNA